MEGCLADNAVGPVGGGALRGVAKFVIAMASPVDSAVEATVDTQAAIQAELLSQHGVSSSSWWP